MRTEAAVSVAPSAVIGDRPCVRVRRRLRRPVGTRPLDEPTVRRADDGEERATYRDPMNLSRGMEYVLVGGNVAVDDGVPAGVRAGSVLRSTEERGGDRRPRLRSRAE